MLLLLSSVLQFLKLKKIFLFNYFVVFLSLFLDCHFKALSPSLFVRVCFILCFFITPIAIKTDVTSYQKFRFIFFVSRNFHLSFKNLIIGDWKSIFTLGFPHISKIVQSPFFGTPQTLEQWTTLLKCRRGGVSWWWVMISWRWTFEPRLEFRVGTSSMFGSI